MTRQVAGGRAQGAAARVRPLPQGSTLPLSTRGLTNFCVLANDAASSATPPNPPAASTSSAPASPRTASAWSASPSAPADPRDRTCASAAPPARPPFSGNCHSFLKTAPEASPHAISRQFLPRPFAGPPRTRQEGHSVVRRMTADAALSAPNAAFPATWRETSSATPPACTNNGQHRRRALPAFPTKSRDDRQETRRRPARESEGRRGGVEALKQLHHEPRVK